MEEKPNYYAVIPANVRYDENLKLGEKMMYGEITSLTFKTGECWASNNYFARLYKVSPQAISKWINALEKQKYITIIYEKEGNRILKRIIKMVSTDIDRVSTQVDRGINSSLEGYQQEIKENNTSNNNTSINNIKENVKRKEYFESEDLNNLFNEFLEQRKKQKAVNSDRAIKLLLNKLEPYDDEVKKQMIEQSILNSWKGIFDIKKKTEKHYETRYEREQRIMKEWLEKDDKE